MLKFTILSLFIVGCAPVPHEYNPTLAFEYNNCKVYSFINEKEQTHYYSDCTQINHAPEESIKFKYTPDEYLGSSELPDYPDIEEEKE